MKQKLKYPPLSTFQKALGVCALMAMAIFVIYMIAIVRQAGWTGAWQIISHPRSFIHETFVSVFDGSD